MKVEPKSWFDEWWTAVWVTGKVPRGIEHPMWISLAFLVVLFGGIALVAWWWS